MVCAIIRLLVVGAIILFLQGCISQNVLTPLPSRPMNTWLLGIWEYKDVQETIYRTGVYSLDSTHYSIEVQRVGGSYKRLGIRRFKAYISRVDRMYFLNLLPMGPMRSGEENNPVILHYQLQSPVEIIVTPLNLGVSGEPWPWKLRQKVRLLKKAGTLFPPGKSMFWQKVSEVYWQKNASLESQPGQSLRLPLRDLTLPAQDAALSVGPSKGFRSNQ